VGNSAKRDVRKINREEKRRRALELRKAGKTYAVVAATLGCCIADAHKLVSEGIKAISADSAKEAKDLALARLDQMLAAVWARATGPKASLEAQAAVLRLEERRAKLLGLDKPAPSGADDAARAMAQAGARIADRLTRLAEIAAGAVAKPGGEAPAAAATKPEGEE
jgi:hypothetical protein